MWIPLDGAYPHLGEASAWLAGPEMYHHTFYQAFWHTAGTGWGLVADLVPLSLAGLLLAWRWRQDPATGDHLRGLRLLTPRRHNREMHGGAIARLLHGRPRGIRLGKSIIPERSECEHFLITGNPGAGKSTAISVVFQPNGNFSQQIPGSNFSWNELRLSLAPDCDYRLAERALIEVVNEVFTRYRDAIQREYRSLERDLNIPVETSRPQSRLRLSESGIEIVIRYPIELRNAAQTSDEIARRLVDAINAGVAGAFAKASEAEEAREGVAPPAPQQTKP
jgi:hypothetical protein